MRHAAAFCFLALSAAGCGAGTKSAVCTTIGCTDQATIGIQQPGGGSVNHALTLDIDGRVVECGSPAVSAGTSCDSDVRVRSQQLEVCFEETVGSTKVLRCSRTGKHELVVEITGTPKTIRVTVHDGATVVSERVFTPQYSDIQPNGPDCAPTCRQWGQTWILP